MMPTARDQLAHGRRAVAWALWALLALAAACASPREPAKSGVDGGGSSIDEANAAFESSERDLHASIVESGADDDLSREEGSPAPQQPGAPPPARQETEMGATSRHRAKNRCDTACGALASMRRAADRLCDLAGEDDGRCASVRHRVSAAQALVREACPRCVG